MFIPTRDLEKLHFPSLLQCFQVSSVIQPCLSLFILRVTAIIRTRGVLQLEE